MEQADLLMSPRLGRVWRCVRLPSVCRGDVRRPFLRARSNARISYSRLHIRLYKPGNVSGPRGSSALRMGDFAESSPRRISSIDPQWEVGAIILAECPQQSRLECSCPRSLTRPLNPTQFTGGQGHRLTKGWDSSLSRVSKSAKSFQLFLKRGQRRAKNFIETSGMPPSRATAPAVPEPVHGTPGISAPGMCAICVRYHSPKRSGSLQMNWGFAALVDLHDTLRVSVFRRRPRFATSLASPLARVFEPEGQRFPHRRGLTL